MKSRLLLAILFFTCHAWAHPANDSLMAVLVKEIGQKEVYVKHKLDNIEKLRSLLANVQALTPARQFDLYNALYHQYKTFIYDSAFKYASKLIETSYRMGDKSRIGYARVRLGFILLSAGMFKESFDTLRVVEVPYLHDSVKVTYYWLMGKAHSDLNVYNKDDYYQRAYTTINQHYLDSALRYCTPGSYYYYYITAVKNGQVKNHQKVIDTIEALFAHQHLAYPQQAVNYYDLGNAYRGLNLLDKTLEYTLRSSLADIRAATKETAAMYTLALLLHERGDDKHAYIFIKQASDDAEFYGARQRMVEIGSILPLIASSALTNAEIQRKLWISYGAGLSVLVAMLLLFAFVSYRQLKRLKSAEHKITHANATLQDTNRKLQEANKIKEEYIGYYLSVNSEYLDKIEAFGRSVEHKLSKGKYDDIKFIVNNINAKREREDLYFNFDKVFLKLFPDFVKTFNSYFAPIDQVVLKDGQLLNTELRIFALIRMGITDTDDIARILGYSVNTIYAYKTRIRNKSLLPNEEFDQKIMEIKAI